MPTSRRLCDVNSPWRSDFSGCDAEQSVHAKAAAGLRQRSKSRPLGPCERRLFTLAVDAASWQSWRMPCEQKVTLRTMRQSGPRRLQIFCGDYKCAHSVVISAERRGPTHDDSGRHTPGPPRPGLPRNGLFALGAILGRIGRDEWRRHLPPSCFLYLISG